MTSAEDAQYRESSAAAAAATTNVTTHTSSSSAPQRYDAQMSAIYVPGSRELPYTAWYDARAYVTRAYGGAWCDVLTRAASGGGGGGGSRGNTPPPAPMTLYFCNYCFHMSQCMKSHVSHTISCAWRAPPGDEVFVTESGGRRVALFRVSPVRSANRGATQIELERQRDYMHALSRFSCLFIECKNARVRKRPEMSPEAADAFEFYVLAFRDTHGEGGYRMMGYFSTYAAAVHDYESDEEYRRAAPLDVGRAHEPAALSCLLVVPAFSGAGLSSFLIDVAYDVLRANAAAIDDDDERRRVQHEIITNGAAPEGPLSDGGRRAFHGYWTRSMAAALARGIRDVDRLVRETGAPRRFVEHALTTGAHVDMTRRFKRARDEGRYVVPELEYPALFEEALVSK